jgi:DNA (cytosine-5)-methyltransferase 1
MQAVNTIQFEGVDLFCGAGGVTTGIHDAEHEGKPIAKVLACVNHDANAIASHLANHPETEHFVEDIRTIELSRLPKNRFADNVIFFLHASLECTNFSNAKGGKPRDGDSRSLADHMDDYILYMQPDIFTVENVREFMAWGKLDANGKPVSRDKGADYMRWVNRIKSYGYEYDYRLINSADHGAYTSRLRYFGIFSRAGINISFPAPTHAKNPEKQSGLFGKPLLKWNAVKHVLDLEDAGTSIFGRKKELSEKTLERIYAGLKKYIANGEDSYLVQRNTGDASTKIASIENPSRTLTKTAGNLELVQSEFLIQYNGSDPRTVDTEGPITAISTNGRHSIIQSEFLASYYGMGENIASIESPAGTITTKDRIAKVKAEFLMNQYGASKTGDLNNPAGTLTANPKSNFVSAEFLMNNYTSGGQHNSIDDPAPCVSTVPKSNIVSTFILNSNFNNPASSIEEPAKTIMANRKHKYLLNPQWFNSAPGSIEEPACTLIARMDKAPLSIVTTETGNAIAIIIYEHDTPMMRKIKEFMAAYGIVDIKMRMLKIIELLLIQGFPKGYKLIGTQTEQKKYIGNAVVSLVIKKWFESLYESNINFIRAKEKGRIYA